MSTDKELFERAALKLAADGKCEDNSCASCKFTATLRDTDIFVSVVAQILQECEIPSQVLIVYGHQIAKTIVDSILSGVVLGQQFEIEKQNDHEAPAPTKEQTNEIQ